MSWRGSGRRTGGKVVFAPDPRTIEDKMARASALLGFVGVALVLLVLGFMR
jgi:hypothetical protein